MKAAFAIAAVLIAYTASAAASWFAIGQALWTGSAASEILVPALMAASCHLAGNAAVALLHRLARRSPLASAAVLAALASVSVFSIVKLAG